MFYLAKKDSLNLFTYEGGLQGFQTIGFVCLFLFYLKKCLSYP